MSKVLGASDQSVVGGHSRMEPVERPLIVAAYRHGEPFRKRRVKVPTNTKWKEFLALIYSRLEIDPSSHVEIYDEQGIEIVDVDDLVENDVLVVKEATPTPSVRATSTKFASKGQPSNVYGGGPAMGREGEEMIQRYHDPSSVSQVSSVPASSSSSSRFSKSHEMAVEHSMLVSTPQLSHFIQLNSFGYYFLAEVENMKLVPTHGKIKKIHCIVKVPHCQKGAPQTFADEASLLKKVSNHKSIVSPPSIQILNFSDDSLQHFFSTLLQQKQLQVRELFMSGGCMEAYIYPLYGVTMATRVKNGLTPEKVVKYSYQLADIMFYLQQRGVIHQNLLPENIQVMSNDRVVLCNFETAVQTDPTSCLLVAQQSVVAPGNRKGLAPEVVRSFSQLRVESESIDYSTQYPWSFGILSVIMATGLHPLKDYPENFEGGSKVKYRSHDYQALPDSEQYPAIFCKLVKRSLSCDPIRRPTLPQILSIIKKDSKTVALMTGKRFSGPSSSVAAQQRGGGGGGRERRLWGSVESLSHCPSTTPADEVSFRQKSTRSNKPIHDLSTNFYDTHPPFVNPYVSYEIPTINSTSANSVGHHKSTNSHHHQQQQPRGQARMEARLLRYEQERPTSSKSKESSDPFAPLSEPSRRKCPSTWDSAGEERHRDDGGMSFYAQAARPDRSPSMAVRAEEVVLRRHSSLGAFSDDFVLPQFSGKESSSRPNLSPAMRRVGSASRPHGSSERLLGRSGTTSESDLSQLQEFQYHHLGHSPEERERLLHTSSPECDQDVRNGTNDPQGYKTRSRHVQAQPHLSPEMGPRSKVPRSNSYQQRMAEGRLKVDSPLTIRRRPSDDKVASDRERGGAERMDMATAEVPTREEGSHAFKIHSLSEQASKESPWDSHQVNHSHSPSGGTDSILMSNSTVGNTTTNTETQSTMMSLELTGQSQRGEVSGSEFIEPMDTQSGRDSSEERMCLISPVFSSLASTSEVIPVSDNTFWPSTNVQASSSNKKKKHSGQPQRDAERRSRSYNESLDKSNSTSSLGKHQQGDQRPCDQPAVDQDDDETVLISPITLYSQTGLDIFPPALSPESNPTHDIRGSDVPSVSHDSQATLLGGGGGGEEDEELTPREDDFPVERQHHQLRRGEGGLEASRGMSPWIQDDLRRIAISQAAPMPSSLPPDFTPQDVTSPEGPDVSFYHPTSHRDYSIMSPIPEASQELTSSVSMSQPNANRLSGSHMRSQSRMRSVSPISEHADVTEVDESNAALRQRSISPFQHSAVSTSEQNSARKIAVVSSSSECGSTAQSSTITALSMKQPQPQHQQQTADSTTNITVPTATNGEAFSSSIQSGASTKRQERTDESRAANVRYQSRSRSGTPVTVASGGNSREGSIVTSDRERSLQVIRGEITSKLQAVAPSTATDSTSIETALTSSTMAQVTIDVTNAVRALTAQQSTTQAALPQNVQPRRQTVTNYSREPIQSSAESLGRSMRGTTPQSTSSAPARMQLSTVDPYQRSDIYRQVSPLSSTASRSATPQMKGGATATPQMKGGAAVAAGAGAHTSKRYSQQRVSEHSPKSQQRIQQDLEMMHLAISGMDAAPGGGHSQNHVTGGPFAMTGPREPTATYGSDLSRNNRASTSRTSGADPNYNRAPSAHPVMVSVESARTFRPITPAMIDANARPISAPVVPASSRRSPSSPSEQPPISASSAHPHQQQSHNQPLAPSIATVSQSVATSAQSSAPQPPQVSADSYDYLPPYSPPQNGGRSRQEQEPSVAAQPPPHQQQLSQQARQQSEPRLYPEPPPSYDEIFGAPNAGGRQRRRRGQRHQRGADNTSGANESGNGRSRSRLRRSNSQNEGPIRQSASQRRLASLTSIFRRVKKQSNPSENTDSSRAASNQPAPPSRDASRPMDTSEYVASWVESYSRTPRPVEAIEAQADGMPFTTYGSYPQARSHLSRAVSDVGNSRTHLSVSANHGASGNPVPYRPPPPFLTAEGDSATSSYPPPTLSHSQALTDYSMSFNRASSDIGYPRAARGGGQASRSNTVSQGHQHLRTNTANAVRRVRTHEQQRRPASAVILSEANPTNLVGIQATHSGTDLATDSRLDSSVYASSVQQQRALSRRMGNTTHTSNSCFDITAPETTNVQQRQSETQAVDTNRQEGVASSLRSPEAVEQAATPPTREEGQQMNEATENQQRSQSMSLSQGHSQSESTSLAANVNANNTNTCASPRASNVSSPINMGSVVGSNSSLRQDSQPNAPSPVSRDSNAAVLSQTVPDPPLPSSPLHCESRSSGTSLSSRAAARHRVEMRLSQQDASSSDEESSQISSRSHTSVVRAPRHRPRRRRSQGSVSQAESFRSSSRLESQLSQSRPADVQEETETNIESVVLSQEQQGHRHDNARQNGTVVEENQEVQTVELAIEDMSGEGSNQNNHSLVSSGKSCGHSCEAESQALCCLCMAEQAVDSTEDDVITSAPSNCSLCQRRCDSDIQQTHGYSNKIHSRTSPMDTAAAVGSGDMAARRHRGGKNCVVM